jgi:hypothetical protein
MPGATTVKESSAIVPVHHTAYERMQRELHDLRGLTTSFLFLLRTSPHADEAERLWIRHNAAQARHLEQLRNAGR